MISSIFAEWKIFMLDAVTPSLREDASPKSRIGLLYSPWLLIFGLGLSSAAVPANDAGDLATMTANAVTTLIAAKQHSDLSQSSFANRTDDMDALYKMTSYQLLWLGQTNSEKNINDTLELLGNASIQGLNPSNYDVEALRSRLKDVLKLQPSAVKKRVLYDTALSLSLLRFLHDLHYGRVNPQGINFNLKLRDKKLADLPVLINSALRQGTISQLVAIVEPKLFQYQKLKEVLAQYRKLNAELPPLQLLIGKSLRPGEHHAQITQLARHLRNLGDLTEDEQNPEPQKKDLYGKALAEAVKKFQRRHGLTPDGVIGQGTAAELNVPFLQRITQIELAMERLRWLPEIQSGAYVIVNIPSFQLWAFDDISKPYPEILNMKVVVGNALKTQTPILMAEMRFIDFMPYWNVPYSIVKNEILPKLLTNPYYLQKENMEMVTGFGKDAIVVAVSDDTLPLLKQNILKIRQRPGKKNALGRVKFMFPNKDDVYLHDTPANSLFSRSRRDFSHGCVRVENPEGLANFALKDQIGWDSEKIKIAMKSGKMQRVQLKHAIPVLFFYTTSFIDENGLSFYPDIYRHDEVLLEVLKKPQDLSDQALFISKNTETLNPLK